jgi:hypothetical protein
MTRSQHLGITEGEATAEAMDAAEASLEAEAAGKSGEATQGIKGSHRGRKY